MSNGSPADDVFIQKLQSIIQAKMSESDFGVNELAREMGMSRSNLHRRVSDITGNSVVALISEARLKRAMELLKEGTYTVSEVSWKAGFGSATYFNKCFSDYYGYPPGEAVKMNFSENLNKAKKDTTIPSSSNKKKILILGAVIIVLLIVVVFLAFPKIFKSGGKDLNHSLAILPFTDNSPEGEYKIINGIRDELHTTLGKIKDLDLVSIVNSNNYINTTKNVSVIGKELRATYILSGSGETFNGKAVLRLFLEEAATGKHIWGESYEEDVNKDIHGLQINISTKVAKALNATLTPKEKEKIETKLTENALAYKYYLFGLDALNQVDFYLDYRNKIFESVQFFNKAVQEDSTFTAAYVRLAHTYIDRLALVVARYNIKLAEQYLDTGRLMFEKALHYDDENAWAYTLKGNYYYRIGNVIEAEKAFSKSEELGFKQGFENEDTYYYWNYIRTNEYCKAIESQCKYLKLKPDDEPVDVNQLGWFVDFLGYAGYPETAKKYTDEIFKQNGDQGIHNIYLLLTEWRNGNHLSALNRAMELYQKDTTKYDYVNWIFGQSVWLNNFEMAKQYLPKYLIQRKTFGDSTYNDIAVGLTYLKNGEKGKANFYIKREIKKMQERINSKIPEYDAKVFYHFTLAAGYLALGEKENAYKYLRFLKSCNKFTAAHFNQFKFPLFDSINNEPEFKEIYQYVENIYLKEHECVGEVLRKYGEIK